MAKWNPPHVTHIVRLYVHRPVATFLFQAKVTFLDFSFEYRSGVAV